MTRYDLFRRRIAPIAFIAAIALMARESCNKQERAHATFVLDFGAAERDVRGVDAELIVGGDSIAHFHRIALDGMHIGKSRFEAALPTKDGELRIDVDLGTTHRLVTKHIHADDGAVVTVPLGPDLP